MLFEDYHLFEFRVGDRRYAIPDAEWDDIGSKTVSAKTAELGPLVEPGVTSYIYYFGGDWRFTITLVGGADAGSAIEYPRFLDGEGRVPPEDTSGLSGFETFLEAIADPEHKEHHGAKLWYGDPFDPAVLRRDEILRRVGKLARRRTCGKAGFAKSRNRVY